MYRYLQVKNTIDPKFPVRTMRFQRLVLRLLILECTLRFRRVNATGPRLIDGELHGRHYTARHRYDFDPDDSVMRMRHESMGVG